MAGFVLREELSDLHSSDVRGLAAMRFASAGTPTPTSSSAATDGDAMEVDRESSDGGASGSSSGKKVFLATSSRDTTAVISVLDTEDGCFRKYMTLAGHKDFVVPVTLFSSGVNPGYFGSGAGKEKIVAVTGSRDCTVKVFDTDTGEATDTFEGHEYQVTGVIVTKDGDVVSASLDKYVFVFILTHSIFGYSIDHVSQQL